VLCFLISLNWCFCTTWQNKETRKSHLFSQTMYYCFARLKPVADFQLILTLLWDSLNLVSTSGLLAAIGLAKSREFCSAAVELCCSHGAPVCCLVEDQTAIYCLFNSSQLLLNFQVATLPCDSSLITEPVSDCRRLTDITVSQGSVVSDHHHHIRLFMTWQNACHITKQKI